MNAVLETDIARRALPRASKRGRADGEAPALDFVLPPELEASEPPEARGLTRDGVWLMVSHIGSGEVEHLRFRDIASALREGDVLVINTSGTMPAALEATTAGGVPVELHLSTRIDATRWVVELRARAAGGTAPYFDAHEGEEVALPGGASASVQAPYARDPDAPPRLWQADLSLPCPVGKYLRQYGFPIRYGYVQRRWPLSAYQTAFATEQGSAEMPSAGRAFTPETVTSLVARGIEIVPLVLHTGVSSLEAHERPYPEYYRVPEHSARRITEARRAGQRIVAVGTTVVRALETVTGGAGVTHRGEGWTDVVVTPEGGAHSVDGLLTGLHEPRASHLSMLEAIAGRRHLEVAYAEALRERYLWHEFGDLHLILP